MRWQLWAALAALSATLAGGLGACVVVDKPRPNVGAPAAPAPGIEPQAALDGGGANTRETLRLALWRLLAGYDAALSAVSTCQQAGLIPAGTLAQIQRLNGEARAAAELVRLSAGLAALVPQKETQAVEAFAPPAFRAPLPATPIAPELLASPLPPNAQSSRLAVAVGQVSSALAAGPCATTLLAGRQAVDAQFDAWRAGGVYVPTAEFDAAIARIDANTLALAGFGAGR